MTGVDSGRVPDGTGLSSALPIEPHSRLAAPRINPSRVTFEEFAAINGASAQGFGDAGNHRRGERHSDKTWARTLKVQRDRDEELYLRRAALREEYAAKVAAGEIEPPTMRERILAIAAGHPDNPSVQAARRIAEKRFGGAGLGGDA